jgi:predicted permease
MTSEFRDLRYAARLFARRPFAATAVALSLGLGIGLNSAVFSLLNALLLHPLPGVKEPSSVITVYRQKHGAGYYFPVSYPDFKAIRFETGAFSGLAAYQFIRVGVAGTGEAEQVTGEMVSANFFSLLGISMAKGRDFSSEEDNASSSIPVVILGQSLWRRRFAADPRIVGNTILINGHPFTVVGIVPAKFRGTNSLLPAELWVPLAAYRSVLFYPEFFTQRSSQSLQLLGRLKPGHSFAGAEVELKTIASRLEKEYPSDDRGQTFALMTMTQAAVTPDQRPIYIRGGALLAAVAGLILLLASVNTANFFIARTLEREQEFATRLALGADRRRLARQLIVESLFVAFLSGSVGFLWARLVRGFLWNLRPATLTADSSPPTLDLRVLTLTVGLALLAALLFSAAPVLITVNRDLVSSFKHRDRFASKRLRIVFGGDILISVQAFLSAICLACAGFFIVSLYNASHIDPGFNVDSLVTASFDLQFLGYTEQKGRTFLTEAVARLKATPGIESVTLAENRLLGGFRLWRGVHLLGHAPADERVQVGSTIVDPPYFQTVRIPILQGRSFTDNDRMNTMPAAIVNAKFARLLWPGRSALGERILLDDETTPVEIIGVAQNVKYQSLAEAPQPFLYLPFLQRYTSRVTLHLRARRDPAALVQTVAHTVRALDPTLPVTVRTLSETLTQSLWVPRLIAMLLTLLSFVALLLAAVGVYSVTSHSVHRRSFEIAVRMALGAQRRSILSMLSSRCLVPLGIGVCGGLSFALLLRTWMSVLFYPGHRADSSVFLLVSIVLLAVGLFASLLPTARAVQGSLMATLRSS